jgi:anti-sigma factor RsiW
MNCKRALPLLSEYLDNSLSARDTWEVDRHLADCHDCTRTLNELRRTVDLVGDVELFEVSADFMTGLQSRLEGLEPAQPRRAWISWVQEAFRPRALPAWGAAMATCALALILILPRFGGHSVDGTVTPAKKADPKDVQVATHQNVAFSASDPFADIGAANLAAHVSSAKGADSE